MWDIVNGLECTVRPGPAIHISIRNNDPLCKMVPSELSLDISLSICGF